MLELILDLEEIECHSTHVLVHHDYIGKSSKSFMVTSIQMGKFNNLVAWLKTLLENYC